MADVTIKPITRILVANRGEIARRVFRTAHEMGIATVAVYADGDAGAPFVREADMAVAREGSTSAETYLDADKVLAACKTSGADALHPGYGFLSENSGFAKAVVNQGITWIGPSADVIAQMGDKLSAKNAMLAAKVPTLPAKELNAGDDVATAAQEIGYPVLIKASAGGGGRGAHHGPPRPPTPPRPPSLCSAFFFICLVSNFLIQSFLIRPGCDRSCGRHRRRS